MPFSSLFLNDVSSDEIDEMTTYDNKTTQSYYFKKLCLIVGIIISIIVVFIFMGFLGQSVYSNNEKAFARNPACKFFHQTGENKHH